MLCIDKLLGQLGVAHFYSTLNLKLRYCKIPLFPLQSVYTSSITLRLGLFGAPTTFQQLIDRILHHYIFRYIFILHIIIFSSNRQCNT